MNAIKLNDLMITPSKVVCIGRNYVEHIEELNNEVPTEPVVFIKPNSAIGDDLKFNDVDAIHYEAEICLLIKGGKIDAVGFGLDLTKRDIQTQLKGRGLPWERSKAFDGSAVLSAFVPFDGDVAGLSLELYINDHLVQQGSTELMIYKPADFMASIQEFLTLEDGDIIMSGTPKGVGKIQRGDHFRGVISLDNQLLVEQDWVVD